MSLLLSACAAVGTDKQLFLLIDQDADPMGYGNHPGAIFKVDLQTASAKPFLVSKLWQDPCDVLRCADGSFLVLDYNGGGQGRMFAASADGEQIHELTLPAGLVDPGRMYQAEDGSIWVVDKNADPRALARQKNGTGSLWRMSADLQELQLLFTGMPLAAPADLCFAEGRAYLLDADSFRQPGQLYEGAIFEVLSQSHSLKTLVRLQRLVSPITLLRHTDGSFLVVDVNADPEQPHRHRGAVYRVDGRDGSTRLLWQHADFRDPVGGLLWQDKLYVVDASADPMGLGDDGTGRAFAGNGRGAIYVFDLLKGKGELLMASKQFANPARLRVFQQ